MNFAKPRQIDEGADRPDAGKWRWTVYNDNTKRVYASGYCDDAQAMRRLTRLLLITASTNSTT